jgi:hypothetical protein
VRHLQWVVGHRQLPKLKLRDARLERGAEPIPGGIHTSHTPQESISIRTENISISGEIVVETIDPQTEKRKGSETNGFPNLLIIYSLSMIESMERCG